MGFMDFLGGNPADSAMPDINRISPMLKEQFGPYQQQGQQAYNQLNPIYSQMGQDPAAFLQQMMKSYQPSQMYQNRRDEAMRAAGNTAAAGGMTGTPQDMKGQAQLADSLMGDDMQQWIQNLMGVQNTGLQGQQHFYDTGYDATKNYAGDLSNVMGTQSQLAFQGQANQNKGLSDLLSAGLSTGGMVLGGMYGGPWGAAAGGAAGGAAGKMFAPSTSGSRYNLGMSQ